MITIQELEGKIENEQINFDAQLAHKLKVSTLPQRFICFAFSMLL